MTTPALTIPKFCRNCGAAWDAHWTECHACRGTRPTVPAPLPKSERPIHGALGLYFCLLGLCIINLIAGHSMRDSFSFSLGVQIMMSVLVIGWAVSQWRDHLDGFLRVPRLRWFGLAMVLSLPTVAIAAAVISTVQSLFSLPPAKMSTPFAEHGLGFGALVLSVAVQPAIIEEIAFRGIVLGGLSRVLTATEAIVVSALMFMTLHLSPARFPHTLAIGLAAGILRVRAKSILPCMVLHFSHNFLCLVMDSMGR